MEQLQFLATAIPKKENWTQKMTDEEKAIMAQHLTYVNQLFTEGRILFSGACLDGAMGLIVYKAESYEAAFEMFGITNTDLHPFIAGNIQNSNLE